jgi:hypothetical protein
VPRAVPARNGQRSARTIASRVNYSRRVWATPVDEKRPTRGHDLPRRAKVLNTLAKPFRDGVKRQQSSRNRPALPSKPKDRKARQHPAHGGNRYVRRGGDRGRGQQPGATFILIHSDSFCLHFPQFSHVRPALATLDYVPRPPGRTSFRLSVQFRQACSSRSRTSTQRNALTAAPPAGKSAKRGHNQRGKATETEQFIAALLSHPTAGAAAKDSAKAT